MMYGGAEEKITDFHIPKNIATWIEEHDGVNVSVNFNSASGDYGYGHIIWHSVIISMLTRTCTRCGYDELWKPDDSESKCLRHTYNSYRYDEVFAWSGNDSQIGLEDAFNEWLDKQPSLYYKPAVKMVYGRLGW